MITREDQLEIIADELQGWLDYHAKDFEGDMSELDDLAIMVPPVWPSRGVLKNWVEVLRRTP